MADATYQPAVYRKQGGAELVITADGQLTVEDGGLLQFGSTASAALLMGAGTSASPVSNSTANKNFLGYWLKTLATTGDTRGIYMRLDFEGIGGSGEAARFYGLVDGVQAAVGGTVNGAHVTLGVAGGGTISGAGNALRATLGLGAATNAGGTIAAIQADSDFAADATIPGTAAAIRVTNSNTGVWANLLNVPAPSNGTIFATHDTDAMTHSIRIVDAAGTAYYLMATTTVTNRD